MKKIASLATTAALLVLAACNGLDPVRPDSALPITIKAGIGVPTRATTTGDSEKFDTGDKVLLYVWTGGASAVPAQPLVNGVEHELQADGSWKPASPIYWQDNASAHYFLGVFPARSISDFKADSFTLKADDYVASDLLVATELSGLTASNGPVKLNFKHMMAKFQLNLSYSNEFDAVPAGTTAAASDVAVSCTVDYLAASVTPGTKGSVALTKLATAAAGSAESHSALMIPQAGFRTVTLVVGGKTYVYTHPSDLTLTSGKTTVLNLLVGRDRIELGSMTIADWTSQGDPVQGEVFKPAA